MKILHLDYGREMQGGQWQVLYLTERLSELGEDYRGMLHVDSRSPLGEEALARHVDVQRGDIKESWGWADLVHAHDGRAHTFASWYNKIPHEKPVPSRREQRPLIVSRRVGFPVKSGFLSRWKYRQPQLYLAVSKYVAAELQKAAVPERMIRVVYDGVPIPPVTSTREPRRVVALKSKPVAIPGIEVHLTTDLWQDLASASVFVYRSEMEGLGSAALAAQAAGVPVVASNVGGLPEAVAHERTGLLVNGDNFEAAVRRLMENPAEAEEMGLRGRERVEKEFSIDVMVKETMGAYKEVLG